MTTSGKVENNVYSNPYAGFRLVLPQPPCDATLNTSVDTRRRYAILLNCVHVVKGWEGMYTFTIALDLAKYPSQQNIEQYVRSLRHAVERDPSQKTVQTEEPRRMAGLDFVQAILSSQVPTGKYYQGIACTQLKGYFLCFETEAPSVDAVRILLDVDHKLELGAKSITK